MFKNVLLKYLSENILVSDLNLSVDIDHKTSNTIKTFVFEWYQFLNTRNNGKITVKL